MAKAGLNGEIIHFGAVRLRVEGNGGLMMTLNSLSDVHVQALATLVLQKPTNIEPTVLSNMLEQRACVVGAVFGLDETFTISKIVVFIRPTFTGVPQ